MHESTTFKYHTDTAQENSSKDRSGAKIHMTTVTKVSLGESSMQVSGPHSFTRDYCCQVLGKEVFEYGEPRGTSTMFVANVVHRGPNSGLHSRNTPRVYKIVGSWGANENTRSILPVWIPWHGLGLGFRVRV